MTLTGRDPYDWKGTVPGGDDVFLRKCKANETAR